MKRLPVILILLMSVSAINAQRYLFDTAFEVQKIYASYFIKSSNDLPFFSERVIKQTDIFKNQSDTTYYSRTNLKGQDVYIFMKINTTGYKDYECSISYGENEDPLWRSDDTVTINHLLYLPPYLNAITAASKDDGKIRFKSDSAGAFRIKTTLFFKNGRNMLNIEYEDLNDLESKRFIKTFIRRNSYYVLKKR